MVGGSDPRMDHFTERMKVLAGEGASAPGPAYNFAITLDGELAQYGPDIRRFVEAMVYKLAKNAHKGKWDGKSIEESFDGLKAEVDELQVEVHGTRNMVAVMLEAADVANFALIVAAIAMERGR